jgi:alkanesulfonate monooxygenase SsuD/methylene tetrahydromethanopterin reductase-like flavin-dependent oxidoreductase (luciferase family)
MVPCRARPYGIPFPEPRERFDRPIEQVAIIDGLWRTPLGKTCSFEGRYYRLTDSPALPAGPKPRPSIIIGRHGKRGSMELAGREDDVERCWPQVINIGALVEMLRTVCGQSRTCC